jgi:hypothetical protein
MQHRASRQVTEPGKRQRVKRVNLQSTGVLAPNRRERQTTLSSVMALNLAKNDLRPRRV